MIELSRLRGSERCEVRADDAAFRKTAHPWLNGRHARYHSSQLGPGSLTAHIWARLMLLGSPPDMVHGNTLRETGTSTPLTVGRRHIEQSSLRNPSLL